MPKQDQMKVLVVCVVAAFGSPTLAQDCAKVLSPEGIGAVANTASIRQALTCLVQQSATSGLTKGAIALFNQPRCPTGWQHIIDGNDRYIVAAGSARRAGTTGGQRSVQLTTANLPKHSHEITVFRSKENAVQNNGYAYHRFVGGEGQLAVSKLSVLNPSEVGHLSL